MVAKSTGAACSEDLKRYCTTYVQLPWLSYQNMLHHLFPVQKQTLYRYIASFLLMITPTFGLCYNRFFCVLITRTRNPNAVMRQWGYRHHPKDYNSPSGANSFRSRLQSKRFSRSRPGIRRARWPPTTWFWSDRDPRWENCSRGCAAARLWSKIWSRCYEKALNMASTRIPWVRIWLTKYL